MMKLLTVFLAALTTTLAQNASHKDEVRKAFDVRLYAGSFADLGEIMANSLDAVKKTWAGHDGPADRRGQLHV